MVMFCTKIQLNFRKPENLILIFPPATIGKNSTKIKFKLTGIFVNYPVIGEKIKKEIIPQSLNS